MHSTIGEAVKSAIKMKAERCALTHFSQRYAKKGFDVAGSLNPLKEGNSLTQEQSEVVMPSQECTDKLKAILGEEQK